MATARRQDEGGAALSAAERKLAKVLRERMADSLLPGEPELSPARLDAAAAFVLETARRRQRGEAAMQVSSGEGLQRVTRIAVVNKDMPFLVDSIAAAVAAQGL